MRAALMTAIVGLALSASLACADPWVKGNDTGGIISWSCEAEAMAPAIAAEHCAWHNKYPRITSVHRQYGDYIAFNCLWTPQIARYALPAMRTRSVSACLAHARPARVRALN